LVKICLPDPLIKTLDGLYEKEVRKLPYGEIVLYFFEREQIY